MLLDFTESTAYERAYQEFKQKLDKTVENRKTDWAHVHEMVLNEEPGKLEAAYDWLYGAD